MTATWMCGLLLTVVDLPIYTVNEALNKPALKMPPNEVGDYVCVNSTQVIDA